jgi:hypothetical protein
MRNIKIFGQGRLDGEWSLDKGRGRIERLCQGLEVVGGLLPHSGLTWVLVIHYFLDM